MTHSQKIAWAKRQGITPPKSVQTAAVNEAKSAKTCCSVVVKKTCCSIAQQDQGEDRIDWSLALQRAKCKGAATQWLTLGACVPLQMEEVVVTLPEVACVTLKYEWSLSPVYRPASPPPRLA